MNPASRASLRVLLAVATGVGFAASAAAQQEQLVGSWDCSFNFSEDEMSMSAEYEHSFTANGESTLDGVVRIRVPALEFDDSFSLKRTARWRLADMVLFERTLDVEIESTSASPSPISQLMAQQLQGMFADGASDEEDSSPIKALTATTLEFDEEGDTISCKRGG